MITIISNGIVFFYSEGVIEVEAPLGNLTINAVHGFSTIKKVQEIKKEAGWLAAWLDKEGLRKFEFPTRGSVQGAEWNSDSPD